MDGQSKTSKMSARTTCYKVEKAVHEWLWN
jgi:hypothetical protein